MTYKSPSGVFNYMQVPDDAGDAAVKIFVNGEEVSAGGSSDFTIAKVTIDTGSGAESLNLPYTFDEENASGIWLSWAYNQAFLDGEYNIPLYKGMIIAEQVYATMDLEGDATFEEGVLTITGDCTISGYTFQV